MNQIEEVKKARIRTEALVDCDFHCCKWKDNGEIFTVEDFGCAGRKKLIADGYGSKEHYGNGAVYAKEEDLIYLDNLTEPKLRRLLTFEEVTQIYEAWDLLTDIEVPPTGSFAKMPGGFWSLIDFGMMVAVEQQEVKDH